MKVVEMNLGHGDLDLTKWHRTKHQFSVLCLFKSGQAYTEIYISLSYEKKIISELSGIYYIP
jgi:hypothetical protein